MRWLTTIALLVGACGRIDFDPLRTVDTAGDGGTGDDGTMPCTFGPWEAPQPITELNTSGFDTMPRLSPDELTIFFHSTRTGGAGDRDVWTANRASLTAPFGTPTNVTELNTTAVDRDPAPTGDGLIIVFSSTRGGGPDDLYVATRASTAQPFSAPQPVPVVNTAGREYFASLSADGLTLYFSSDRGGGFDIWYATRPTTSSSFSAPQNRSEVNTPSAEHSPMLSADGLELYLSSSVSGNIDIWLSTRADPASPFGAPSHVAALSTSDQDLPSWISPDGRRLYLSTGVLNTSFQLFVATRPCT